MPVQPETFLASLRTDARSMSEAMRASGLDAPIEACPGWTVADLASHTGLVHRWATRIVGTRATERVSLRSLAPAPEREELLPWFDEGVAELALVLEATGPEMPIWTFSATDESTRFWFRRMAHETAVHRWDAESAAGAGTRRPIAPDLAADGIDEFSDVALSWSPAAKEFGGTQGATIHLHATDVDGEWLLRFTPDGVDVTREHAKGDVAARASASKLFLFLWNRVPPAALEVFGDRALLERWPDEIQI